MGLLDFDANKLVSNPLLQMGMGILGSNRGNYGAFAPAFGQGVQQGMANLQAMQQQQMLNDIRKQQMEMQNKQYELENKKYDRELKKPFVVGKSLVDPVTYKPLYQANSADGADPYFSPIATDKGLAYFDHRSGKLQLIDNGGPVIKSTDSPAVRGAVKSAESEASANWKVNTDLDGTIATDAQVARAASGLPTNNFGTPYPVTFGAPGSTATDMREGTMTDGSVAVRNPAKPGFGIKTPTAAEKAAEKKSAETIAESAAKKEATMSGIGDIIEEARSVLTGKTQPTHSKSGVVIDALGTVVGYSPEGAAEADKLRAIGGALVAKMPRMEGPQSNYDVENYKIMAGDVGNPALPIERRVAALNQVDKLWRKYDKSSASKSEPARTVKRTGKYNGRKVIEYSDGSVEYAN